MKIRLAENILNAIKSKEYWLAFSIIIVSSALTSIYNLIPTGIFYEYRIGNSEFFIAATMFSNIILKIASPSIAIFACLNRQSVFLKDKEYIQNAWSKKEIKTHVLSCMAIGGSIFLVSFLILYVSGLIIFPSSTGSIQAQLGMFKQVYQITPDGYVFIFIFYSFICGALYALFGISLKILFDTNINYILVISLVFYNCFMRACSLFPFVANIISPVCPYFTFDIVSPDVTLIKRAAELSFVLIISIITIITSYFRNRTKAAVL